MFYLLFPNEATHRAPDPASLSEMPLTSNPLLRRRREVSVSRLAVTFKRSNIEAMHRAPILRMSLVVIMKFEIERWKKEKI